MGTVISLYDFTGEASRIASMAKDGAEFLRIWESEDWWRDAQAATS